jgi:hypothetical protein
MNLKLYKEQKAYKYMGWNAKVLVFTLVFLSISISAYAIPRELNVHGRLTDDAGNAINGSHNITFLIYDAYTAGNLLYNNTRENTSVDLGGLFHTILPEVEINTSSQLFMAIEVNKDGEMTPRTNLTSSPYTFRANYSDYWDNLTNPQDLNETAQMVALNNTKANISDVISIDRINSLNETKLNITKFQTILDD